jgi:hypothetical protein
LNSIAKKNPRPHNSNLTVNYQLQNWVFVGYVESWTADGDGQSEELVPATPPATGKFETWDGEPTEGAAARQHDETVTSPGCSRKQRLRLAFLPVQYLLAFT